MHEGIGFRPMKYHVLRYLLLLLLLRPALIHAQCDVVATVFDTEICQAELTLPNSRPGAEPLSSEERQQTENYRLSYRIRTIAVERLLERDAYTPTDEEVQRHIDFSQEVEANRTREDEEIIAVITNLLDTYQYTERYRNQLENALALRRSSLKRLKRRAEEEILRDEEMRKRSGDDAVKNLYERIEQGRREISEQWVGAWKMNKALYEKYGGRIIFQQAGIEPIDAYRALLKDIREKGDLKIAKPEYEDVFGEFERYLDMGHNYLSESGEKYFDRPYWETADLGESHRRAIDEYKAIPHK